jgi:hypothetical protein
MIALHLGGSPDVVTRTLPPEATGIRGPTLQLGAAAKVPCRARAGNTPDPRGVSAGVSYGTGVAWGSVSAINVSSDTRGAAVMRVPGDAVSKLTSSEPSSTKRET